MERNQPTDLTGVGLRHLRYLQVVADGLGFGEAADELGVSQSALSQGLARLEGHAGVALFEPDGRRRRLTTAGEELAAYARRVLTETDRVAVRLDDQRRGDGGVLRIAMIDAAVLYLCTEAVAEFRQSHPAVDVRITVAGSDACLTMLDDFSVDLAVVVAPAPNMAAELVAREPFFLYGQHGVPQPGDPWALYPRGSHTRAILDGALAALGIVPLVSGESGNPSVLRELTALMGGWTVLPGAVGDRAGAMLFQGMQVAEREVLAVRRPTSEEPLVERFLETVRSGM